MRTLLHPGRLGPPPLVSRSAPPLALTGSDGDPSKCPFTGGPNGGGFGDYNLGTALVTVLAVLALRTIFIRAGAVAAVCVGRVARLCRSRVGLLLIPFAAVKGAPHAAADSATVWSLNRTVQLDGPGSGRYTPLRVTGADRATVVWNGAPGLRLARVDISAARSPSPTRASSARRQRLPGASARVTRRRRRAAARTKGGFGRDASAAFAAWWLGLRRGARAARVLPRPRRRRPTRVDAGAPCRAVPERALSEPAPVQSCGS